MTFDTMIQTMKQILRTGFACLICIRTYAQTNTDHGVILPTGRMGRIVSFDEKYVTCETKKGKEFCGWVDLEFPRSCNIETNSSLRFDQRYIDNKAETITRTLIAIHTEKDKWHCYLIDDYRVDPVTRIKRQAKRQFTAYSGAPCFIDNQTIVITPNYQLIAFRDYNHDGKDEIFSAWRSIVTRNGQLIPESSLKMSPRWTCTFKAWGNSYYFNFDQNSFPLIPEPSPNPGCVCWGNSEYSLEALLIEGSDRLIRYPVEGSKRINLTEPNPAPIIAERNSETIQTPVDSNPEQGPGFSP